jgi:3-hydroxyisobutyrate dehydrogenase-like beta-hydroxyacid dehydrogenase
VTTAIAWLGLGHMGAPMARRMLDQGHQLTVWNRTPQRTEPLAKAGARVAQSPSAAAAEADYVITMLTDFQALDGVLFGDNGVLAGMRPGGVLVQMSTISPEEIRSVARRMPAGTELVDSPVVGSTPAAKSGSLAILTGGKPATLDRVEPLLEPLGTVRRVGDIGAGSALKLVINTGMLVAVAALGEAMALADTVGVSREVALEAMKAGPLGGAVQRVTGAAQFSLALAAKDLRLAMTTADIPLPMTDITAARMAEMISAGQADQDIAVMV